MWKISRKPKEHKHHASELRACARHGHITYKPTDDNPRTEQLRQQLFTVDGQGQEWSRCLRCGTFVAGGPVQSGLLKDAPEVMRGSELRQATIMRLLAVERIVRALFLVIAAYAIFRFRSAQNNLQAIFDKDLPIVRQAGIQLNIDVESSTFVHLAQWALGLSERLLFWAAIAVGIYAAIQVVEGVGLWLHKRWGEWFAVIATSMFIPLEVWEVIDHLSVTKIGALVINLAAIAYLVYSKKLWPGGAAIYEAMHSSESLLELPPSKPQTTTKSTLPVTTAVV